MPLSKGYIVHGIKRRASSFNTDRVDYFYRDQHEQDVRARREGLKLIVMTANSKNINVLAIVPVNYAVFLADAARP